MTRLPVLTLLLLSALVGAAELIPVEVEFVNPQTYRDAQLGSDRPRKGQDNPVLAELRKHMQSHAPRYLRPGQQLSLSFRGIDLAGEREPTTDPDLHDVRIIRSVYPPRLEFDYRLQDADGAVLLQGQADLRDVGFNSGQLGPSGDPLRYEKRMLERWLARTLGASD